MCKPESCASPAGLRYRRNMMKAYGVNELRKMFLDFFESKGHLCKNSYSLIPHNDNSVLLIPAGMAPLKPYFTGQEVPPRTRMATCQKCIRTGDIDNVGITARHLTFFEMLGNFSFGDYFKEEAIEWSWEFLTEVVGLDADRLYPSIYQDDDEAFDIWNKKMGIPAERIFRFGKEDNFWEHGAGPCGPCSEIYYDRGEKYGCGKPDCTVGCDCDRYIEIWNNVFTQFDGDGKGNYVELDNKNIDTGMGLERLAVVVQDVDTVFSIDTFKALLDEVCHMANDYAYESDPRKDVSVRVIVDHIRSVTFMVSDGIMPSNEGRGYVLRRVLRRAMRYGRNIGIEKPFLYELVDVVCENMKDFYPYLMDKKEFVKKLILKEEESFLTTLSNGEKLLADELKKAENGILSGEVIFRLYDTYGFPKEMTIESAEEKGLKCDIDGFNACMEKQREMARNARDVEESMHNQSEDLLNFKDEFVFTGYEKDTDEAKIIALFKDGKRIDALNDEGDVVFDHSCFYAESGGQCADTGKIYNSDVEANVSDVKKAPNGQFLHHVKVLNGELKEGLILKQEINAEDRLKIRANHSSVHLLQAALISVLGNHIAQAGSYVCKYYARFDFSHYEKVTEEQLSKVEELVNTYISEQLPIVTQVLTIDEAKKTGAIALFDEKYGDTVRVVSMGDVSKEFCGGTHAFNTSDLGSFKINYEESIGSGIRRIEMCTKLAAYEGFKDYEKKLNVLKDELKLKNIDMIYDRLVQLKNENSKLNGELKTIKEKLMNEEANSLISKAKDNGRYSYLLMKLNDYEGNLKDYASGIRNKLDGGFVFIVNSKDSKLSMIAAAGNKALDEGVKCGEIISKACQLANGKGGGRPDLAQGGGTDTDPDLIIKEVEKMVL